MTAEQILEILNIRAQIAKENGNSTELSLIYELQKLAKEKCENESDIT